MRSIAVRLPEESTRRERLLSVFGPILILVLLTVWITQQVVGFALIWWGFDGVAGVDDFADDVYYSGVVFFTVGFGEVLPEEAGPRFGAIVEAACGVVTVALVVGYLPSLYSAYSDREAKLQTIDDGSEDRITPTSLVMAWAPDGDAAQLDARFEEWHEWTAGILETHTTLPILTMFRSHDRRQHWITALGLLCDAAIHAQIIEGSDGPRSSYWFLRRAVEVFDLVTEGADLSPYDDHLTDPDAPGDRELFDQLYATLVAHGFDVVPYDEAAARAGTLRNRFARELEFTIDNLLCPRGFWSPAIGLPAPARSHAPDSEVTP